MSFPATASQTVGPYFRIGLSYLDSPAVCTEAAPGEHISITGQVFDADGNPVTDGQLEIWQADDQGRFAGFDATERGAVSEGFVGFARVPLDERGAYKFRTVIPGSVPTLDGTGQAPHIVVMLSMRGLLKHLYTRIYFDANPLNDQDPILAAVPPDRRSTLCAQLIAGCTDAYVWNVRLQGEDETVFFAY